MLIQRTSSSAVYQSPTHGDSARSTGYSSLRLGALHSSMLVHEAHGASKGLHKRSSSLLRRRTVWPLATQATDTDAHRASRA
eukprot:scaffold879_cov410-Prasinococcus_capsulatus_cf.AAC.16